MTAYRYYKSPTCGHKAKALRKSATKTEHMLWKALHNLRIQTNIHFRRQHPLPPYFADFACVKAKLVIELDGMSHDTRQSYDAHRDATLHRRGWMTLRFRNEAVEQNLEGVVISIIETARMRLPAHPQPLPQAGGGTAVPHE